MMDHSEDALSLGARVLGWADRADAELEKKWLLVSGDTLGPGVRAGFLDVVYSPVRSGQSGLVVRSQRGYRMKNLLDKAEKAEPPLQ